MSDGGSRDQSKFIIRMPDGMRDRIKAHAEAGNRSMNMQIVYMLESALFQADYNRLQSGLDPLGDVPQDDLDRMHLFIEDNERKARGRSKALSEHGVSSTLSELDERMARIEKMLVKITPPQDKQARIDRKNKD